MCILIVDDHPLVRRGIIDILSMNKVGDDIKETGNIEDAMKALKSNQVNIIMVDLHLGLENGFDLIERAKVLYQKVKYVILTSSSSLLDFRRAKQLNVDGYILKDAFVEDIIYALSVIRRGEKFYSPRFLENTMNGYEPSELQVLTEREKEVLSQLSTGLTNAQISDVLYISEGTTKKHISNILAKLNMNNRIEAVLFARKLYGK